MVERLRRVLLCAALSLPAVWGERVTVQLHAEAPRPALGRRKLSALVAALGVSAAGAEDVAEAGAHFNAIDEDGDGRLSLDEFNAYVVRSMNGFTESFSEQMQTETDAFVGRLFAYADVDGDGFLNDREEEYADFIAGIAGRERTIHKVAAAAQQVQAGTPSNEWSLPSDEFGTEHAHSIMADTDTDGDGRLTKEEYDAAMRLSSVHWGLQGLLGDPALTMWFEAIFARGDIDQDGVLGLKEAHYTALLADNSFRGNAFIHARTRTVAMILGEFDLDHDGKVTEDEVRQVVARVHAEFGDVVPSGPTVADSLLEYFAAADADGDKALDRDEAGTLAEWLVEDR